MLVSGSALKTYNLEVRRALCRGESAGEGFAVPKIVRICRSGFMTSCCEFFFMWKGYSHLVVTYG
jgi:hypothetical protein